MNRDENAQSQLMRVLYDEPSLITYVKERYITDDIWMFCIEREPSVFENMKRPNERVCNFAVEIDGSNLKHVREKFTYIPITNKMCYNAVKSCPKAILDVPKKLLSNGLMEMAFDAEPSLMIYFNDIRPEYIKKKVSENPSYLKYINDPDEDFVCEILLKNPNTCVYLDRLTPRMLDIMRDNYPDTYELYTRVWDI